MKDYLLENFELLFSISEIFDIGIITRYKQIHINFKEIDKERGLIHCLCT